MKTVLHLIPTLEGGGAERQLAMLAGAQARAGWQVHIGLRRRGVHAGRAEREGATLHPVADRAGSDPRVVWQLRRLIDSLRPDLVQTWLPPSDVCGGLAATLCGVPWIMTERASVGAYPAWSAQTVARRGVARLARAIVCNSRGGTDYWSALGSPRRAVVLIGNAVEGDAVRAAAARGAPAPPLVLSVGRLVESKAHDHVLRAWERVEHDGATLQVIGDGPLRGELEALSRASTRGVPPQLHGFAADWWERLGRARLLVSLSRHEGAPNVVLEAVAAGVPVVLSDIPAHRELLCERSARFVAIDDLDAVAAAIGDSLADPAGARARAELARQRIAGRDLAAVAAAYARLYASVLGEDGVRCAE